MLENAATLSPDLSELLAMSPKELKEDLATTAFQLGVMYKQWAKDMQTFGEQCIEIETLQIKFKEQVEQFKTLEAEAREEIHASIQRETVRITQGLRDAAEKAVEPTTKRLENAAENAEFVLASYKQEVVTTHWKIIGIGLVVSITVGILIARLLMPHPVIPFTDSQMNTLQAGRMLEKAWPKLSQKEKERVKHFGLER